MKLKFVDIDKIEDLRGRRSHHDFAGFVEELYKYPDQWAEFPDKIVSSVTAYRLRRFKDIDIRVSGGNHLPKDHPDKKTWTVYACFSPGFSNTQSSLDDTF